MSASGRYPQDAKFRKLFATFDTAQRRRFWDATGIDIKKQSLNQERFGTLKRSLAEYQEFLKKSANLSSGKTIQAGSESLCEACGRADQSEIYFTVPKCIRFCMQCTKDLIREVESG